MFLLTETLFQEEENIHQMNEIFNFCCLALVSSIKILPKILRLLISKRRLKKLQQAKPKKFNNDLEYSEVCLEFECVKIIETS